MIETATKELGHQGLDFQTLLQRPGAVITQVVLGYLHSCTWEACTRPIGICPGTALHFLAFMNKKYPCLGSIRTTES